MTIEQWKHPGFIGGIVLHNYMGIMMNDYKDPY